MLGKKGNGKINYEAIGVLVVVILAILGGIRGYVKLQAQSDVTETTVLAIVKNTTEKTEGTLKSDVVDNKDMLAFHNGEISVLKSTQSEMKIIQTETKQAIINLNNKMDTYQRDIMGVLLDIRDNNR